MDDIKLIPNDEAKNVSPPEVDANGDEIKRNIYKEVVLKLASVGRTISNTYSEENQNTGEGFVDALKLIEDIRNLLLETTEDEMPIYQRDSLKALLSYLEEKVKKRATAADHNDYNM